MYTFQPLALFLKICEVQTGQGHQMQSVANIPCNFHDLRLCCYVDVRYVDVLLHLQAKDVDNEKQMLYNGLS